MVAGPLEWSPQTSCPSAWPTPPGISSPPDPEGCHRSRIFLTFCLANYLLYPVETHIAVKFNNIHSASK